MLSFHKDVAIASLTFHSDAGCSRRILLLQIEFIDEERKNRNYYSEHWVVVCVCLCVREVDRVRLFKQISKLSRPTLCVGEEKTKKIIIMSLVDEEEKEKHNNKNRVVKRETYLWMDKNNVFLLFRFVWATLFRGGWEGIV